MNSEVFNEKMISYLVVGIGSLLWIIVFILLIRTFRKKYRMPSRKTGWAFSIFTIWFM
ncbi:MAG: hypothetical protein QMB61_08205 [Clostridiaceae bacterium]